MREYSKIYRHLWVNHPDNKIHQLDNQTRFLAIYLVSNPHVNMIGMYYLPLPIIAHEMRIPLEGALEGLQRLFEVGYATYDDQTEYIWVHDMASEQIDAQLKSTDNRVKAINETYRSLPNLPFLSNFYDKYADAFHLEERRVCERGFKAPSKPLRSQEQEQKHKQGQEQYIYLCDAEKKSNSVIIHQPVDKNKNPEAIISIPLRDHREFHITTKHIEEFEKQYPDINVIQTLQENREWSLANADKRKTSENIIKHLHFWFSNERKKKTSHVNFASSSHLLTHNQSVANDWLRKEGDHYAEVR
jgi:hypothetical protein